MDAPPPARAPGCSAHRSPPLQRAPAHVTLWHIRTLFAAAGLAVACGGAQRSDEDAVPDPPGRWIEEVSIEGNQEVGDDAIISGLATRPPEGIFGGDRARYDSLIAQVDADRIESFYRRQGFFSAKVKGIETQPLGEDELRVEFVVDEGEPATIATFSMIGLPEEARGDDAIEKATEPLARGRRLEYADYEQAKQAIRERLVRMGYARATVDGMVAVARDERRADVSIQVEPGTLVKLGRARITGAERIPESAIRARLVWDHGDRFHPMLLSQSEGALYQLGMFSAVRIELPDETSGGEVVRPEVRVTEAEPREVRLGGGVAGDDAHWEVRARAGYRQYGFLDPLTVLDLEVRPAYTFLRSQRGTAGFGGEARAGVTRYDLGWPLVTGELSTHYRVIDLDQYQRRGPGGRVGVSRPFWDRHLVIGAGWHVEYLSFFDLHPAIGEDDRAELGLVEPHRLGSFEQRIALDFRDDILDPRTGGYLSLRLEEGGPYAGGRFDYLRGNAEARGYLPAGERIVLAARAEYAQRLAGELPITRRFFAGGTSSHRGFGQRRLAPVLRGDEGSSVPIGGDTELLASFEIRWDAFPFMDRMVGFTAFVDAGDVTPGVGEIDAADLHWAPGLGLRYDTPVGPLRLDVARRVTRTGSGEPDAGDVWAFHFSVGEAF